MQGKRFVAATEIEKGRTLSTALLKYITGGENITVCRKYEHQISFPPTHTLWMSGNHKPQIKDTTNAIWRRVKLIPFTSRFTKDGSLPDELMSEAEGILAWLVQGCQLWLQDGLSDIQVVKDATGKYRADEDQLTEYFDTMCRFSPNLRVNRKVLLDDYHKWCEDNTENRLKKRDFYDQIRNRGVKEFQSGKNYYWEGMGLLEQNAHNA